MTPHLERTVVDRAAVLLGEHRTRICRETDRLLASLLLVEWVVAIAAAHWLSPLTWWGLESDTHVHVWAAWILGGAISLPAVLVALAHPGWTATRFVVAAAQMLMSALLIHLSGGRIETHFHVFGSLAFLAFYRDWRVFIPATLVVALDHLLRGIYWPASVYGVASFEPWRWLEHAGWVAFEDVFLIHACLRSVTEMKAIARQRAELEIAKETTERVVAERTADLRQSEERFRSLTTMLPVGVFEADTAGLATYVNPRWCEITGLTAEAALGTGWTQSLLPEDRDAVRAAWPSVMGGQDFVAELRGWRHPRPEIRIARVTARPLHGEDGRVRGVVSAVEDVTDRRRFRRLLEGQKHVLEMLAAGAELDEVLGTLAHAIEAETAGMRCAVQRVDGNELLVVAAPSLPAAMAGALARVSLDGPPLCLAAAAVSAARRGERAFDVASERTRAAADCPLGSCRLHAGWAEPIISSRGEVVGTLTSYYEGARRPSEAELELVRTAAHVAGLAIERRRVEAELASARDKALEAAQLKSEFLANVSHEIRTPMAAILGMTDMALDTELNAEQRDYLDTVKASALTLLTMLNDILDFSKVEAGRLDLEAIPFGLRDMLSVMLRTLAPRAHDKGVELVCDVARDVPDGLIGDPGRLRQVLLNLVHNAVKFTEEGEVVLRVRTRRDGLRFAVSDTGIGVPRDRLRMIFDAFVQADGSTTRRFGGTGLGLAIASRLVHLMGGRLEVESEEGRGSTFHFAVSFGRAETFDALDPQALQGERILVASDHPTTRAIVVEALEQLGARTAACGEGPAAMASLASASADGRPFTAAIVDLPLRSAGRPSPIEGLRRIPALATLPIVALAALTRQAREQEVPGEARRLAKPIGVRALLEAVRDVLRDATSRAAA